MPLFARPSVCRDGLGLHLGQSAMSDQRRAGLQSKPTHQPRVLRSATAIPPDFRLDPVRSGRAELRMIMQLPTCHCTRTHPRCAGTASSGPEACKIGGVCLVSVPPMFDTPTPPTHTHTFNLKALPHGRGGGDGLAIGRSPAHHDANTSVEPPRPPFFSIQRAS